MKLIFYVLIVFLSGMSHSLQCNADNGVKHVSKVEGVSPMWMYTGELHLQGFFTDRDDAKLITHCNGNNNIFVYELGSKEFNCKSRFDKIAIGSRDKDYYIDILGIKETDKKVVEKLSPSGQGIYTVSRNRIPQNKWAVELLPLQVIAQLQELSKNKYKCPDRSPCQPLVGKQYKKGIEVYEGQIKAEEIEKLAIKIKGNTTDLLITPVAIALVGDVDGGTAVIISMVFSKTGETLKFIGSFNGNLIRVGADIDQDGLPELIVDSSVETSQTINFFKIHPKVETLMSYEHW